MKPRHKSTLAEQKASQSARQMRRYRRLVAEGRCTYGGCVLAASPGKTLCLLHLKKESRRSTAYKHKKRGLTHVPTVHPYVPANQLRD
jgi:hypothetical protein